MTQSGGVAQNRWWLAGVGILIMLMFGMIYAWSVFVLPLEREFGWSREQTSLTFSITMTFFSIGIFLGGLLADRKGPRFVSIVAGCCIGAGLWAASLTTSLAQLYVSYGVVCGLSVGISYNCVISTIIRWFPDYRGAVSGLLMMGFGLGGLVLGFGASRLIEAIGWRAAFQILGAAMFFCNVVLGRLLRPCPERHMPAGAAASSSAGDDLGAESAWRETLRAPMFWLLWFWQISVISGGLATVGHIVPLAIEAGFRGDQAAYALGAFSVLNGVGRLAFGYLSDRLGRRRTMLADSLLMIGAMALFLSGYAHAHYAGLLLTAMLAGVAYGGAMPQVSAAISLIFGSRNFGANFGLVSSGIVVAALAGPYLSGVSKTASGSYAAGFAFLLLLAATGLFAAIVAARRGGRCALR